MHSGIVPPTGVWWKPIGRQEKMWVTIALVWCMVLFTMMPLWHLKGGQNPTGYRAKVLPGAYIERVNRFVEEFKVGEERSATGRVYPIVEAPPGSDIYMMARMWEWYPILKLKKGATYTLHIASIDLNHGFSLHPININLQIPPGYDYALKVTPNEAGDFRIICNEFCGIGHHNMVGKIIVVDGASTAAAQRR